MKFQTSSSVIFLSSCPNISTIILGCLSLNILYATGFAHLNCFRVTMSSSCYQSQSHIICSVHLFTQGSPKALSRSPYFLALSYTVSFSFLKSCLVLTSGVIAYEILYFVSCLFLYKRAAYVEHLF